MCHSFRTAVSSLHRNSRTPAGLCPIPDLIGNYKMNRLGRVFSFFYKVEIRNGTEV